MSKGLRRIWVVGGAVIAVAAVGASPYYISKYKEYRTGVGDPASRLPQLRLAAQKAGLDLLPEGAEATNPPNVRLFKWIKEELKPVSEAMDARVDPKLGKAILESEIGSMLATSESEARGRNVPSPQDLIVYPTTITERKIAANVARYGYSAIEAGDAQSALKAVGFLSSISRVMVRDNSAHGVAAIFGTQVDVCRLSYLLWSRALLDEAQTHELLKVFEDESTSPRLDAFLQFEFDKMIATTRGLDQLSASQQLDLSTGEEVPRVGDKRILRNAMESDVLAFWLECLDKIDRSEPELAGAVMDRIAEKWAHENRPSRFMVRTMGQVFEQQARMISRIAQARYLMTELLRGEVEGSTGTYAGVRVFTVAYNLDGREGLAAPSAAGASQIDGNAEFWIDQRGGVFAQTH